MINANDTCRKEILNFLREGRDVSEIITFVQKKYFLTREAARKRVKRVMKSAYAAAGVDVRHEDVLSGQSVAHKSGSVITNSENYDAKGNTTYDGQVIVKPGEKVDADYILRSYGMDPKDWVIRSYRSSRWNATLNGETVEYYAFKLTVAPKAPDDYNCEEVYSIIEQSSERLLSKYGNVVQQVVRDAFKVKGDEDGAIIEVDFPDVHVNLRSWLSACGAEYDCEIVDRDVMHAVEQIYEKLVRYGIKIKKIEVVTLGDWMHVDNDVQTTTRGTFQQVDGSFEKMVDTAFSLLVKVITLFATIAPVEYIYIPGNHDKNSGWMLAYAVSKFFADVPNVTCDCENTPYKCRVYGKGARGWHHGDMPRNNLAALMDKMLRNTTDISYKALHVGHRHHHETFMSPDGGTEIEYLDSVCPASAWEYGQGYGGTACRTVTAFIWDGSGAPPDKIIGAVE